MSAWSRRRALGGLGATLGTVLLPGCERASRAREGRCPAVAGRRVRWIVPNAAGGGLDTESRLIAPFLAGELGAEVLVANIQGAGGILGAQAIANAAPDGLTLGLVNAAGLLVAAMTDQPRAPDPAKDLAVLGRVSRSWHLWAAGSSSPFRSIEDVLAARRPVVFGIQEVGSPNFVSIAVTASLLSLDTEMVAGFAGTRSASLAALRGEVDMVSFNFDTISDLVAAGDLRPLLQVSDGPIADHAALRGVPCLAGDAGWAVRRAREGGRDATEAAAAARALVEVMAAGRIVAAPPGLEEGVFRCLEEGLHAALVNPALRQAAGRTLDVARAEAALAAVRAAGDHATLLVPVVQAAIRRLRG
jgi:tripartite-type tricarboxylate transporter receptor subunit TctC